MKLLVAIDLCDSTEKVVEKTAELAKRLSAQIWLLHVAEPEPDFVGLKVGPQTVRDSLSQEFHEAHRRLQEIADHLRLAGLDTTALLIQGATTETILAKAARLEVDMIIVGSHGRGAMYQLLVGSVSEEILHKAACPVLVVPTHDRNG